MNIQLGAMHSASFRDDPKHLAFVLARYHFVARMLHGVQSVLEVGCGDTTGAVVVQSAVGYLLGIDKGDDLLPQARRIDFMHQDILEYPVVSPSMGKDGWGAVYALDVLEHIALKDENRFFANINATLDPNGTVIVGSPSLESQPHASELSKLHHVNCKTEEGLRATLQKHYHNVFLFGMNDSTLHTGFGPMCHYRLGVCCGAKNLGQRAVSA
jgi:SAM-dependent methyltransferase